VLIRYLAEGCAREKRSFVMGELPFVAEMARAGFRLTENPDEIRYVVALRPDLRLPEVQHRIPGDQKRAHFIATNPDRTCPVEGGSFPTAPGSSPRWRRVTLKKVEVIVGKPSPITVQAALEVMGLQSTDCLLIGDGWKRHPHGSGNGDESGPRDDRRHDAKTLESSPIRPTMFLTASLIWNPSSRLRENPDAAA